MFKINKDDEGILHFAKNEANILLKNIEKQYGKDSEEYLKIDILLKPVIRCCSNISKMFISDENKQIISDFIDKATRRDVFSPLTLNDTEFVSSHNIRTSRIFKPKQNYTEHTIVDLNAYDLIIKHAYDHNTNKEILVTKNIVSNENNHGKSLEVHLCAGGVTIGTYFKFCFIDNQIVKRHCYIPKPPIHIPVSVICTTTEMYYIMDIREPKFKALCDFYIVPKLEDNLKSKFDVRKYEKLSKTV